jgi:hypothetical protein
LANSLDESDRPVANAPVEFVFGACQQNSENRKGELDGLCLGRLIATPRDLKRRANSMAFVIGQLLAAPRDLKRRANTITPRTFCGCLSLCHPPAPSLLIESDQPRRGHQNSHAP